MCPVGHGRLADLLGYDRRDVAVLAVDAALAVELRARSTPHDRGRALSAAIANAVYHATGRRIRSLPITIDQLLARGT